MTVAACLGDRAAIARASGVVTAPSTNTAGAASTPIAVARAVTYGGQSR